MNSLQARIIRSADMIVGRLLSFVLAIMKPNSVHRLGSVKTIAVIRLWAIGESILALPAITAIKKLHPSARITVITTPYVAPVFNGQSAVDDVVLIRPTLWSLACYFSNNWRRFDVVFDFEPYLYAASFLAWTVGKWKIGFATRGRQVFYNESVEYNDHQHVVNTNLDLVEAVGAVENNLRLPLLSFSKDDKAAVDKIMADWEKEMSGFILIAPGVGGSALYRMWPWQRFAQLADKLIDRRHKKVVWVGEPKDKVLIDKIQNAMMRESRVVNNLSLSQLFYLVSRARLLIANDSGIMHVGAAMKAPTLGLFGPNTPVRFGPLGKQNRAIYHQAEGGPCINVHKGEIPRKSKRCTQAMLAIQVKEVYEMARRMLFEPS